ncbi:MAG: aldo/keto reductase [Acidobacteria bacterium]|nr:aldo/keto reductase [Acidobacteriota bacterium]
MELAGFATPEGTARYRERFAGHAAEGHFRQQNGLWLSSVGIGTYLGAHDDETDERYARAVARALELGVNVVDTAINYRFQRSERSVGAALGALIEQGKLARDEVIVASKAGFLTFDGDYPPDPAAYFQEHYFRPGVLRTEDVVAGMHCMTPRYLEDQLERSRRNLGLDTLDVYFLHNPETQLQAVPRAEFLSRIRAAYEKLEECMAAGKIRCYGTATWDGYRQSPRARDFLSLEELLRVATEVAGANHHFRCVQLPYNLAMPEALLQANQPLDSEAVPLLEAARRLGITVFASASLLQGQVARNLPDDLRAALGPDLETDAQRALQFVRSTPGVGTALVGMSRVAHVEENLRLVAQPLVSAETFRRVFFRE